MTPVLIAGAVLVWALLFAGVTEGWALAPLAWLWRRVR